MFSGNPCTVYSIFLCTCKCTRPQLDPSHHRLHVTPFSVKDRYMAPVYFCDGSVISRFLWTAICPRPLQELNVPIVGGFFARCTLPSTTVCPGPLKHLQATSLGSVAASPNIPRIAISRAHLRLCMCPYAAALLYVRLSQYQSCCFAPCMIRRRPLRWTWQTHVLSQGWPFACTHTSMTKSSFPAATIHTSLTKVYRLSCAS